ncbi:MAG: hypothetical protein N2513_05620 [Deltaproteobacteria bacterium]|nr:hypothetical protein [Deltaproteobacteria bacterium]
MWKIVYRFFSYLFLIPGILFLHRNEKTKGTIRERLIPPQKSQTENQTVWIHAASIGEAIIAIAIKEFLTSKKKLSFVVTTNTIYAKDLLKRELGEEVQICYAPLDVKFSVRSFMRGHNFRALLLIETELWPNMIWEAKRTGVPVLILNGRISDRTFPIYRKISFFMKDVLSSIDFVLAQSELHAERFRYLGVKKDRIRVMGNIKYLRRIEITDDMKDKKNIVTFGSVRSGEKRTVLEVIEQVKVNYPYITFFVAPREFSVISELAKSLGERFRLGYFSAIKEKSLDPLNFDVVIVDTVGDLPQIYRKSLLAFVGGSLIPHGGHNILEPLFFGTPVLFGPYIENFKDLSEDIMANGAGAMVKDQEELRKMVEMIITDDSLRKSMANNGWTLIKKKKDEIEKELEVIFEFINKGGMF